MANATSNRTWLSSVGRELSAFMAQFGFVRVEASAGQYYVGRLDRKAVETLHNARRAGLCVHAALPLLFDLLIRDASRQRLEGAAVARLSSADRRLLLEALIDRNASIFGISTVSDAVHRNRAAKLDDIAWTFVESYLHVDDIVGSEIIAAIRSSNA